MGYVEAGKDSSVWIYHLTNSLINVTNIIIVWHTPLLLIHSYFAILFSKGIYLWGCSTNSQKQETMQHAQNMDLNKLQYTGMLKAI